MMLGRFHLQTRLLKHYSQPSWTGQSAMIEIRDRRLLQPIKIPPLDYLTTVVFYVLLPFLAYSRAIRLNYEWTDFFLPYFISVAIYSIFVAAIFHLIDRGLGASLQYVRSIANG